MRQLFIFAIGALLLAACGISPGWRNTFPNPMMGNGDGWVNRDRYESSGEQIYFTSTNEQGERIRSTGGQNFGGMMGGGALACSSCHGPDGRGGIHTMHMDVMDAPDIRYSALSGGNGEHDGEDSHSDEHGDYDLDAFRSAVVEGKHPNGDDLSGDMPRWQIKEEDLLDLFEYLKSVK